MRIVFISNFMNHHQLPLCHELIKNEKVEFTFIATKPIDQERLNLGYADSNGSVFVFCSYQNADAEKKAESICFDSDVLIIGSASEKYYLRRLLEGKLTFRYNERIFKKGLIHIFSPKARRNMRRLHAQFDQMPVWLLCAGAYVASDFNRMGAYKSKCLKWGYFPELKIYSDIEHVIESKEKNSILWVGRFIDWKHPELAVEVARYLKKRGVDFHIDMIGTGEMIDKVQMAVDKSGLTEDVSILGSMPPEKVRSHMEKSEVFLFTSDFNEGWGAVLNEAMNSGCAVVASHAIGAVPYLLEDQRNGFIYKNGDGFALKKSVERALTDNELRKSIQIRAYRTVSDLWNAETAADRLINVCDAFVKGKTLPYYADGPCSVSQTLKNNWFK